jgi:hypothetical protein
VTDFLGEQVRLVLWPIKDRRPDPDMLDLHMPEWLKRSIARTIVRQALERELSQTPPEGT